MPVHHRLWLPPLPLRTPPLCSLWPDMRPLRFRRVPFGRDGTFDPGGATASRIAMPHILPSTVPSVSASATFFLSWRTPPPHPSAVYAPHPPSPTTAQHSLPGGALPPYRGRSFTGWNASASPDAPELEKFRARSGVNDPAFAERQAARHVIDVARDARTAERKAARLASVAHEAAEKAARYAAAEAEQAARDAEVARQAANDVPRQAEQKTARDARYAARKARPRKR